MEGFVRDVRYSFRMLVKTPGTTIAAVLSLALGIGANTTIFTLINAVFLNPIPVESPSELVSAFTIDSNNPGQFSNLSPMSHPNFEDLRDQNEVFEGMAAYTFPIPVNLTTSGEPEQVFAELVSGSYFEVLGVAPQDGRFLRGSDDVDEGGHPVVVVGHGLWQRRFGGDAGLVGREIQVNGLGFTVVGIAKEGFKGVNAIGGPELWVPTMMYREVLPAQFHEYFDDRRWLMFSTAARLKDGVTLEQADANLATIAARLEQEYPVPNKDRSVAAIPLTEATIFPGIRQILVQGGMVLMVVVGLVLLVACSNVASLLLAKATSRRREIAIRLSLGASRRPLVRQLLVESVILSMIGGAVGLVVAVWGRDLIWSVRPPFVQSLFLDLSLDARVLGFTFLVATVSGILFGLAPALQSSRPDVVEVLKAEGRGTGPSSRRPNLRNGLVVAQVALSLMALVAAGLFLRSLGSAHEIETGFETERMAVLTVNPGQRGYDPGRVEQFYKEVIERVQSLPGVASAAFSSNLPLFGGFQRSVFPEGQESQEEGGKGTLVITSVIDPGYFRTAGIALQEGRDFEDRDSLDTVRVAIVNEAMVEQFWPDGALGSRFQFYGDDFFHEIVGVAATSNYVTVGEEPRPAVFVPLRQNMADTMSLHIRSEVDPGPLLVAATREIRSFDPEMPITNSWTVGQVVDQSLWAAKLGATLLTILGGLALALAAVGLYGVMAFWVGQRDREIGIRMALGARAVSVMQLVLRQGLTLVGLGAAAGILAGLAFSRSLSSLLYGISPTDPATYGGVVLLLLGVSTVASLIPALRAVRVDPLKALRIQ